MDDLQLAQSYTGWRAYANSKLANVLFTRALAARIDSAQVVVHAMHPGVVSTRFGLNNGRRGRLMRRVMDVVAITPEAGVDTLVWLCSNNAAGRTSGDYWVARTRVQPSDAARNAALANALWTRSAALAHLDADALIAASGAAGEPVVP